MNSRRKQTAAARSLAKPSRPEWTLLGVVMFAAVAARCCYLQNAVVEHFDEGVYASNLWFGAESAYGYPFRHLYAPPLIPLLEEMSILMAGTAVGPLLPSLIAGIGLPLLLWWVGRSWFTPAAGLVAAALAAGSDVHAVYSRTALTDAPLALLLLGSVYLIGKAIANADYRWAIPAGAATGLAWATKYNGWLPLVIGAAGVGAWWLIHRPKIAWKGLAIVTAIVVLLSAGLFAAVVLPSLPRGYGEVAANHRQYVVGLSGWWGSFAQHAFAQRYLTSGITQLSLLLAPLAVAYGAATRELRGRSIGVGLALGAVLALASVLLGGLAVTAIVGGVGLGWFARTHLSQRSTPQASHSDEQTLGFWLVAVWFVGLLAAIPCYRAYPRLTLAWQPAVFLLAGVAVAQVVSVIRDRWGAKVAIRSTIGLSIPLAVAAVGIYLLGQFGAIAWEDRTSMQHIAAHLSHDIQQAPGYDPNAPTLLLVDGEPGLFYHLRALQTPATPIANLAVESAVEQSDSANLFLVIGPHTTRAPKYAERLQAVEKNLEPIAAYPHTPSRLVRLNNYTAQELTGEPIIEQVQLFRIRKQAVP